MALMKLQLAIVIGAIIVSSVATAGWAFVQNNELSASTMKSSAGMLGHITLTAFDENGNTIAYRQTDNVIINKGDDCLLENTLGVATNCQNPTTAFNVVHIGTGTTAHTEGSPSLTTWYRTTGGTAANTISAAGTSGASAIVTASFLDVSASIGEAALYNSALSAGDILALQQFTAIPLGPTDDLTIQWTVTIDG